VENQYQEKLNIQDGCALKQVREHNHALDGFESNPVNIGERKQYRFTFDSLNPSEVTNE